MSASLDDLRKHKFCTYQLDKVDYQTTVVTPSFLYSSKSRFLEQWTLSEPLGEALTGEKLDLIRRERLINRDFERLCVIEELLTHIIGNERRCNSYCFHLSVLLV
jgi:hypothetical protein